MSCFFFQVSAISSSNDGDRHIPIISPTVLRTVQHHLAIDREKIPNREIMQHRRIHHEDYPGFHYFYFRRSDTQPGRGYLARGRFQQFCSSFNFSAVHRNHHFFFGKARTEQLDAFEGRSDYPFRLHWIRCWVVLQFIEYIKPRTAGLRKMSSRFFNCPVNQY